MRNSVNLGKKRKRGERRQEPAHATATPTPSAAAAAAAAAGKKLKKSSRDKNQTKHANKSPEAPARPSKQETTSLDESGSEECEGGTRIVDGNGTGVDSGMDGSRLPARDPRPFSDLKLPTGVLDSISSMGLIEPTSIQRKVIPLLLEGRDVIALSGPGSGKTTSILTSIISSVAPRNVKPRNGTIAIVLTPTRESALRLQSVASELLPNAPMTLGIAADGSSILPEIERLERGVNILIATPRRLLRHLKTTPAFVIRNLRMLVVDDADRVSKLAGVAETLSLINEVLPEKKQTALFSVTAVDEAIIEALCPKSPQHVHDGSKHVEPIGNQVQGYVIVEPDKRFLLLYSFLRKFQRKKIVVVLSSTAATKGYADILSAFGLSVFEVHGKQTTRNRATNYSGFKNAKEGILLCMDAALRGPEIPAFNWLIQYDPPEDPPEYIVRLGRLAEGRGVIFLLPEEQQFVQYLNGAGVMTEEFEFSKNQLLNVQSQFEKLVSKIYQLHTEAKDSFSPRSYLKNYAVHPLPSIFDISKLNIAKAAKSFGFDTPPRVDLNQEEPKDGNKGRMIYGPPRPGHFPGKIVKRRAAV